MPQYYLAVDIGASSGRHILGCLKDGRMVLREIHRFSNGVREKDGHLVWDMDRLFGEVLAGMKKCADLGQIPVSVGVDTWGVDFVLLGENGVPIYDAVSYRDSRTKGMDRAVYAYIPESGLYARTGIQKQKFNTIYQLMAIRQQDPGQLDAARTMLLIPDYFHYLLTGKRATEYTNATTTQLVDLRTGQWDTDLIRLLGYPEKMFAPIIAPGTYLGDLTAEIQKRVGYSCRVVVPCTHDTASAVAAVPAVEGEDVLYISSGTWSLMGTELQKADCSAAAKNSNFTNEGGYDRRFRFLKNIMGLWMIQSVKKEIGEELSFAQICEMAGRETISSRVDCNDGRFLAPHSMTREVQAACRESGQPVPEGVGQVAAVIYNSLADCYRDACAQMEALTGKRYDRIRIVGGGSNAGYLNRQTAKAAGRAVYAGPTEATAAGNLAVQMIAAGELRDLAAARACIAQSFPIHVYRP